MRILLLNGPFSACLRPKKGLTAVENVPNNVCFPIFCAQELDTLIEKLQIYTFPTKKRVKKLIEPFSRKLGSKFRVLIIYVTSMIAPSGTEFLVVYA